MSEGTNFRDKITDFITIYGSTIVITPVTKTIGTYGGYDGVTRVDGTPVSTKGIPSKYLTNPTSETFGRLPSGDATVVIKYSEVVAVDYKLTYQSTTYDITEIKEIYLQDVCVGKRLYLSRRVNNG